MAMAMDSVRMKPLEPTKVGIRPRGFNLRYSVSTLGGRVSTSSMSRLFSFAMARRTVERALSLRRESVFHPRLMEVTFLLASAP